MGSIEKPQNLSTLGLQHALLLTETKRSCAYVLLMTAWLVIIHIALGVAMHIFQVFNSVS